ncbi:hypothetical protein PTSG_05327 [Salpingoeca rosetta]|uniref:PDZ domain-containing protein n=1 Tax=Salpingoeca rosetta (strain ATCC 50818 / BSB-021) TaxID=946362 RepID=F2UA44_SALR5|nr:uncharacterized protein PTSG_05327 [Salpingoeca rosetta]EGD73619.1 hypothetical protein PTSG_05327 [Salpingoeca rosetta]|eukprot:XP_004993900.1 hypothetical protein PTSG_05327 [Salpingoeca rosetta]
MARVLSSLRDGVLPHSCWQPSEEAESQEEHHGGVERAGESGQGDGEEQNAVVADGADWQGEHPGRPRPRLVCVTRSKAGLGVKVAGGQPAVLVEVDHLGPAYAAGVRDQDQCLAVNGVLVLHLSAQSLEHLFDTCEDEYIKLLVLQRSPPRPFAPLLIPRWDRPHIDAFGFDTRLDADGESVQADDKEDGDADGQGDDSTPHNTSSKQAEDGTDKVATQDGSLPQEEPAASNIDSSDVARLREWDEFLKGGRLQGAQAPHWTSTSQTHGSDEQFLTAFAGVASMELSLRIWDCFLYENVLTLFKVSLSLVTIFAPKLTALAEDLGAFMRLLSSLPMLGSEQTDHVMQLSYAFQVVEAEVPALRQEYRADLQAEYDAYRKRMDSLHASRDSTDEDTAALQGSSSFWHRVLKRRASAVYLNGLSNEEMSERMTGLGEAIQHVMVAAAEQQSDSEAVTLLVHNSLCVELARVLRAGLCVSEAKHPWIALQAAVAAILDDHIKWQQIADDVYSEQQLRQHAATFAAAVQSIDQAHKRVENSDLNVKLRSLICLGLNGGELHAWIRILSRAIQTNSDLRRFYSATSALRNPHFAKQIELHLQALLRNTHFHLAVDMEWSVSNPPRKSVL